MLNVQEINTAIMFGTFTNDQLNSIVSAIKFARGQLTKQNRRTLVVGTKVKFVNSRLGTTETGVVTKMMLKNAVVKTQNSSWRVPVTMLESI